MGDRFASGMVAILNGCIHDGVLPTPPSPLSGGSPWEITVFYFAGCLEGCRRSSPLVTSNLFDVALLFCAQKRNLWRHAFRHGSHNVSFLFWDGDTGHMPLSTVTTT